MYDDYDELFGAVCELNGMKIEPKLAWEFAARVMGRLRQLRPEQTLSCVMIYEPATSGWEGKGRISHMELRFAPKPGIVREGPPTTVRERYEQLKRLQMQRQVMKALNLKGQRPSGSLAIH
jgi:hypothetical protein